MIRYRAEWILPIADDPIAGGWVAVDQGRITGVGAGVPDGDAVDLGRRVILPALVNAHTHLELSHLRGRIPPAAQFVDWVRLLMAARRETADPADLRIVEAARAAIQEARAWGTGLVGDVSNTLATVPLLRELGMPAHVFFELLGFRPADAQRLVAEARGRIDALGREAGPVRVSLAPHAPYSVSRALFEAIRSDLDAHPPPVSSLHLGESPEELEFLARGSGPFRTLLMDLGVWDEEWKVPGVSPVRYATDIGFLDASVLAVHGVQFDGDDLATLASLGITIVSCPRSNQYVGVGAPPLEAFYAMDVDVAFGTDSLASVDDLSVFSELAVARRLAPRVRARQLLESATRAGARALRRDSEFGSIEPGKRAALIAVRVPAGVVDVEEYLVGGVRPDAIEWLPPAGVRDAA